MGEVYNRVNGDVYRKMSLITAMIANFCLGFGIGFMAVKIIYLLREKKKYDKM